MFIDIYHLDPDGKMDELELILLYRKFYPELFGQKKEDDQDWKNDWNEDQDSENDSFMETQEEPEWDGDDEDGDDEDDDDEDDDDEDDDDDDEEEEDSCGDADEITDEFEACKEKLYSLADHILSLKVDIEWVRDDMDRLLSEDPDNLEIDSTVNELDDILVEMDLLYDRLYDIWLG